jgi:mono/diheme cytochrome c family protein
MWRKCLTDARGVALAAVVLGAPAAAGCRQDMHDQPKLKPLRASTFFADGRGSRYPVEGTVARGQLKADRVLEEGRAPREPAPAGEAADKGDKGGEEEFVDYLPFPATAEVLARGRERFDIFCSPCHARTGEGDGMIVRRGYRTPPSLHSERVRTAKLGHLYDVITRGLGAMPSCAPQIRPRDRWAIVAYVRALELSQWAPLADVPADARAHLDDPPAARAPASEHTHEELP